MAWLLILLFAFTAVFMILRLDCYIDIRYEKRLTVTLTLGIISVELKGGTDGKAKSGSTQRKKYGKAKRKIIFESILSLTERTEVTLRRLSVPKDYYHLLGIEQYKTEAIIFSVISLIIAYLETKTAKLYSEPDAFDNYSEENISVIDISIKCLFVYVLRELISIAYHSFRSKRRLEGAM